MKNPKISTRTTTVDETIDQQKKKEGNSRKILSPLTGALSVLSVEKEFYALFTRPNFPSST